MGLKEGDLSHFFKNQRIGSTKEVADEVGFHILQALDYLDARKMIHRDVKPGNILYEVRDGKYHFILADFGLSKQVDPSYTTGIGTPDFTAPEVLQGKMQTTKVDVWSLYVTLIWILDIDSFRTDPETFPRVGVPYWKRFRSFAARAKVKEFREMGEFFPEKRASAAQMLLKCWNGEGLTTPRVNI